MNSRRAFLSQMVALGGLASLPPSCALAQTMLSGEQSPDFETLSVAQASFLAQLADHILPATDTPAASATGVVAFIDTMLTHWYSEPETVQFLNGLNSCRESATGALSQAVVADLDSQAFNSADNNTGIPAEQLEFYRVAKELVLVGYFTSRRGMLDSLHTHGPVGQHSFAPSGPPGGPIGY
jgi:glucoside 3-dehydrogenase (cytochrome c) hitch-hiker subunit